MLLIIDPQIDFISGSLPVPQAEAAMNALARYVLDNPDRYDEIVVTADKHSYDHMSFTDCGGEWPRHCVHDTVGATIWPRLFEAVYSTNSSCHVLHKGMERDREEYSIFSNRKAAERCKELVSQSAVKQIDICGLAGDVCVLNSLKDGMRCLPECEFNVLTRFSPSIDGGRALTDFITKNNVSCDRL